MADHHVDKEDPFEQWIADMFTGDEDDLSWEDGEPEEELPLADYLIRFNREIDRIIRLHGTDNVGSMIWNIYGGGGGIVSEAFSTRDETKQLEVLASVKTLYADGFDPHCDIKIANQTGLNGACYMLWDMDGIEYAAHKDPQMMSASLDVLAYALTLRNPACQQSALHGLGHLVSVDRAQVQPIIRDYLQNDLPRNLRHYAESALIGDIM